MWHIFRLFVVRLFTLSLFCILKWNFNVMKISRQQLLIAWQATDGDSCNGSRNFKCCNSATPTRRQRRRPRCDIAYVSYKTCKYLSGYAKKRKSESQKRKQINWLRLRYQSGTGEPRGLATLPLLLLPLRLLLLLFLLSFSAVGKSLLQKLLKITLNFAQITEGVQF